MYRLDVMPEKILVKPILENEVKTRFGLILPDALAQKPIQGEVVAVGKGKHTDEGILIPLGVNVGDKILFSRFSGHNIMVDDESFHVINESDIYAILRDI